jgi:uncharacterized Tic20 family protein
MTQPPNQNPPGPPPGYYPPQPPPGYASGDDKTWALISHFGGAIGSFVCGGVLAFVAPLVAYLAKSQSSTVKAHATAALNFFIPVSAAGVLAVVLRICVGALDLGALGTLLQALLWLAVIAVWAVGTIFGIIAGIKANEGALYKYPLPFTIVK